MRHSATEKDTEAAEAPAGPLIQGERIAALDIIRGLAILGILLANITAFSQPEIAYYWPPAITGGAEKSDEYVWLAQYILVDGKFRGLFGILFGAGMALFVDRIADHGRAVWMQARRLFWLGLFGIAHFYFLFTGDILFMYACAGLVTLLALNWSPRSLLVAGLGWSIAASVLLMSDYLAAALIEMKEIATVSPSPAWSAISMLWDSRVEEAVLRGQLYAHFSYGDIVSYHWQVMTGDLLFNIALAFYDTIPLILIGMGLFRTGLFTDAALRRTWRRAAWAGVALSLALNAAAGWSVFAAGFPPYQTQLVFIGLSPLFNLPMLLGGTLLLTDWAVAARENWLGERLALAGRMAFTNYIGTSLVMVLIFQGWAGGLFGTMHRMELLLVVALGWALMLTGSRLWLARFRYGPLEWLWRCLTYGQLFAIRQV